MHKSSFCRLFFSILSADSKQALSGPTRDHGLFVVSANQKRMFHSNYDDKHSWSVLRHIYEGNLKGSGKKYACFALNISDSSYDDFERYKFIWDEATVRVAVDGSANPLAKRRHLTTTDIISGDFDSIDPKLIQRLQSPRRANKVPLQRSEDRDELPMSPHVIHTPCQKETDFTKAIRVVMGLKPDVHNFFGLYHNEGFRLDHLFALVNTLHLIKKNIFLINTRGETLSWLLIPGHHTILKPKGQEICSLVPFTGATEVKTQGLQYNITPPMVLSYGGIISTSNLCHEQREKVVIDTNRDLLWSVDLRSRKLAHHKDNSTANKENELSR